MDKKIIGYFQNNRKAEEAANELQGKGFKEISILGKDDRHKGQSQGQGNGMGSGNQNLTTGTTTGGVLGGLAGLALGAGALMIPGLGPIVAMGPLAATLGGAVTGGVAGALVDYGIPQEHSDFYEDKIKEGYAVMIVKADEGQSQNIADIFRKHDAQDVRVH